MWPFVCFPYFSLIQKIGSKDNVEVDDITSNPLWSNRKIGDLACKHTSWDPNYKISKNPKVQLQKKTWKSVHQLRQLGDKKIQVAGDATQHHPPHQGSSHPPRPTAGHHRSRRCEVTAMPKEHLNDQQWVRLSLLLKTKKRIEFSGIHSILVFDCISLHFFDLVEFVLTIPKMTDPYTVPTQRPCLRLRRRPSAPSTAPLAPRRGLRPAKGVRPWNGSDAGRPAAHDAPKQMWCEIQILSEIVWTLLKPELVWENVDAKNPWKWILPESQNPRPKKKNKKQAAPLSNQWYLLPLPQAEIVGCWGKDWDPPWSPRRTAPQGWSCRGIAGSTSGRGSRLGDATGPVPPPSAA